MPPEASVRARAFDQRHGFCKLCGRHIVEKHGIDTLIQHLAQLVQRIHLDFDLHHVSGGGLGALDRLSHPACNGNVIILDEDCVIEREAVVDAAPARTAYFSSALKPGVVLRVQASFALVPENRIDNGTRHACHAREVAHEVQCRALCRQKCVG